MKLEDIQKEMEQGQVPPARLAEIRTILSGKYARASTQMEEILMRKPAIWNQLRKDQKSDTATERVYQGTEDGMAEVKWKLTLRRIEKMMSACKTQLEVLEGEARNQW